MGFEPTTLRDLVGCSNHLSYWRLISRSYENRSIQNRKVSCENNFRGMWVLFSILFKIMLEGNRSKVGKIEFNGNEDNVPNQPSFNVFN